MDTAQHFRKLLDDECQSITDLCTHWKSVLDSDECPVSEEASGKLLQAIGQGQLLVRKKLEQFRGLIDDCENGTGFKEVTVEDLQGFWELVYIQVEDIHQKFAKLKEMEKNSWKEVAEATDLKRHPLSTLNKDSSKAPRLKSLVKKDFSADAKQRLAQAKAMARKRLEEQSNQAENIIC